jgi:hypothetical protein
MHAGAALFNLFPFESMTFSGTVACKQKCWILCKLKAWRFCTSLLLPQLIQRKNKGLFTVLEAATSEV